VFSIAAKLGSCEVRAGRDVAADPADFQNFATVAGWGDGLPLVPPREGRVARFLDVAGADASAIVADHLPPSGAACTMEKLAINAVMAGAPPESLPLLVAALRAMSAPGFELHSLNATTGSVVPLVLVSGPVRDRLGLPYEAGCLGGVAGPAPAIGRALRLVMRNVAGQQIGVTSQTSSVNRDASPVLCSASGRSAVRRRHWPSGAVTLATRSPSPAPWAR
jgi:hypothetical protein